MPVREERSWQQQQTRERRPPSVSHERTAAPVPRCGSASQASHDPRFFAPRAARAAHAAACALYTAALCAVQLATARCGATRLVLLLDCQAARPAVPLAPGKNRRVEEGPNGEPLLGVTPTEAGWAFEASARPASGIGPSFARGGPDGYSNGGWSKPLVVIVAGAPPRSAVGVLARRPSDRSMRGHSTCSSLVSLPPSCPSRRSIRSARQRRRPSMAAASPLAVGGGAVSAP